MNKADLSKKLAKKTGIPISIAGNAITALFDADNGLIAEALTKGDKVQLTGFGTFERRTRSARTGRNPSTGEPLEMAEKDYPAFKAGKTLKDRIAG